MKNRWLHFKSTQPWPYGYDGEVSLGIFCRTPAGGDDKKDGSILTVKVTVYDV